MGKEVFMMVKWVVLFCAIAVVLPTIFDNIVASMVYIIKICIASPFCILLIIIAGICAIIKTVVFKW